MSLLFVKLQGESLPVRNDADLRSFEHWLEHRGPLALDTETTGLDIFTPGFRCRLVILGDAEGAWVLPAERMSSDELARLGDLLVNHARRHPITFHNATFDRLVLDRAGILPLEALGTDAWHDTRLMAHLLDPRARSEGGTGHGLKDLSDLWIDPEASTEGQSALRDVFKENKWSRDEGWAKIDLDHPDFVRYAGLDAILTQRLYEIQAPHLKNRDLLGLYAFERQVADLCARMERRGLLVDTEYVENDLIPHLEEMEADGLKEAASWGVENVNSTAQVADALRATGWEPIEFTATGKDKVDKAVLEALAEQGSPIAASVMKAKRAGKWMTSYAEPLVADQDSEGRIHPKINSLQARTARMSVARPPLQQLPSGDWRIRRAIVADPGEVLWAADYEQVEMRVLAAMAKEDKMLKAIAEGVDLHSFTASLVWGPDFTKAQRKLAKGVGFGKVYGGGALTIARQTGAPIEDVKRAVQAYDSTFPKIRRFQKTLEMRAEVGRREVVTQSGRPLPLDGDRLYAATNYAVQSTSRDVLCQAMLDLEDAGLEEYLLLPIHDEILGQCPADAYEDVSAIVGREMSMDFLGVRLDAAAELYGPSWGHAYGAPPLIPLPST